MRMRTPEPHKRVQAIHARATFTMALKSAGELKWEARRRHRRDRCDCDHPARPVRLNGGSAEGRAFDGNLSAANIIPATAFCAVHESAIGTKRTSHG